MKISDTGLYKRCSCTELVLDERGKPQRRELGQACPLLTEPVFGEDGKPLLDRKGKPVRRYTKHGDWGFQCDVAPEPGSSAKRKRLRRSGFATKSEAKAARDAILAKGTKASRRRIPNDQLTVAEWLDRWLFGQRAIRPGTLRSYTGHCEKYLKTYLGRIKLVDLTSHDVRMMFDHIDAQNREIEQALEINPRRGRGSKAQPGEVRETRRAAGPATQQRIRATLRAALNGAINEDLITSNPAGRVQLQSGDSPKAIVWTPERVARWRQTGEKPSPVMVWTPQQVGAFLDYAKTDRLYRLYLLAGHYGLRRGEVCGLRWVDVDLDAGLIHIEKQLTQAGWAVSEGDTKSKAGRRTIPLGAEMAAMLKTHRKEQREARMAWGEAWQDSGRVFTQEGGSNLIPDYVSDRFRKLIAAAGLPPVRLHDLRHGAATLALAAGVDISVVKELLGHSTVKMTEQYTSVFPELKADAVARIDALIPRAATGTGEAPAGQKGTGMAPSRPTGAPESISERVKHQVKRGGPPGARTLNPRIKRTPDQSPGTNGDGHE